MFTAYLYNNDEQKTASTANVRMLKAIGKYFNAVSGRFTLMACVEFAYAANGWWYVYAPTSARLQSALELVAKIAQKMLRDQEARERAKQELVRLAKLEAERLARAKEAAERAAQPYSPLQRAHPHVVQPKPDKKFSNFLRVNRRHDHVVPATQPATVAPVRAQPSPTRVPTALELAFTKAQHA
jgi:hypothetical protein